MSGMAEALYAAADICGDDRYGGAADEALDYELEAFMRYRDRFGTWADLRDFPPKRYMHGYCAGAPGTGIMARRMLDAGRGGERACMLAERVRRSVDSLPLNSYDHLCCGNAAIAEYYLTVADHGPREGCSGPCWSAGGAKANTATPTRPRAARSAHRSSTGYVA